MADNIRQWLEELGLRKCGDLFVENGVDMDIITELDDNDLKDTYRGMPAASSPFWMSA